MSSEPNAPLDVNPGPTPRRRRSRLVPAVAMAAVLAAAVAVVCAQPQAPDGPTKPAARDGQWLAMHERFLDEAGRGGIDLLFLGDSITAGWEGQPGLWDRYYRPRRAANFGIGGDRTQHVLWRIDHGELDGIKPRVVVVLIGTNNLGTDTPAEIADGITAVVKRVHETLPDSKILLLGIFPRDKAPESYNRIRLQAVNSRIARLDDGKTIAYLDLGRHFLNADGTLSRDVMPDYLHLSRKGYRLWADAIEPKLWEMMEGTTTDARGTGGKK